MPGILIAFEGIDGTGKSTQVRLLAAALDDAKEPYVASREPTGGVWGRKLRESAVHGRMSLDDELHAFIEDRKEHIATVIEPNLQLGKIVILDRYFYSTIAYQGVRGKDVSELNARMRSFAPVPDVVFLLDVDPGIGLSRIAHSRGEAPDEFERLENLAAVRKIFLKLHDECRELRLIDGRQEVAGIRKQIAEILLDGVFKSKRCTNPSGCEGIDCPYQESGACRWAQLFRALQNEE